MGAIVMAGVALGAFFRVRHFSNSWIGVVVAVVVFFGWMWFNYYSALGGMVKINMKIYSRARQEGAGHIDALRLMITRRYPRDDYKHDLIWDALQKRDPGHGEVQDLQFVIHYMAMAENGPGKVSMEMGSKLYDLVEKEYAKQRA